MKPVLYISPTVWSKLMFLAATAKTEVSGWGISFDPKTPFTIDDFALVEQECASCTTEMDDDAIAKFAIDMAEKGFKPSQFNRIWIHTHPSGCGATPSGTDEKTFTESLGNCDWAIMLIVNQSGASYARLQINSPVSLQLEMDVEIDFLTEFDTPDFEAWEAELKELVREKKYTWQNNIGNASGTVARIGYQSHNLYDYDDDEYDTSASSRLQLEDALDAKLLSGEISQVEYDTQMQRIWAF
ncbi:MAG: hypothetical protein LLF76_02595 [Planctomycetaceae bacterium]|nr:hypothetical protein [Planctomycetaceae bacterium]